MYVLVVIIIICWLIIAIAYNSGRKRGRKEAIHIIQKRFFQYCKLRGIDPYKEVDLVHDVFRRK
ncbi:MAG: hypothetical protein GY756_18285 [bacterium]|nr:hypothetical protein [bacterium]